MTAKTSVNTNSPTLYADDVVAQQRRRDDARRQLASGDLDRDEQRAEREDDERQRQRDRRLVERLRAGDAQSGQPPPEPRVQDAQRRGDDEHEREWREAESSRAPTGGSSWRDRCCSRRAPARTPPRERGARRSSIFWAAASSRVEGLGPPLGISVMEHTSTPQVRPAGDVTGQPNEPSMPPRGGGSRQASVRHARRWPVRIGSRRSSGGTGRWPCGRSRSRTLPQAP